MALVINLLNMWYHNNKVSRYMMQRYDTSVSSNSLELDLTRYRKVSGFFYVRADASFRLHQNPANRMLIQ